MKTLKMYDLLGKRVLVTRASARDIWQDLVAALVEGQGEVALDFSGVYGLTPSFLDETLAMIEEGIHATSEKRFQVTVLNPPTQLSSKFAAVGRGHDLEIKESDHGAWIISEKKGASSLDEYDRSAPL